MLDLQDVETYWAQTRSHITFPRPFHRKVDDLADERLKNKRAPEDHPELAPMRLVHPILPVVVYGHVDFGGSQSMRWTPSWWIWKLISIGDEYGDLFELPDTKVFIDGLKADKLKEKLKLSLNELIRESAVQLMIRLLSEGFGNLDEVFRV